MTRTACVIKTTTLKVFGITIFVREEVVRTGEPDIEVEIDRAYFDSEFKIEGDK